MIKFAIVGNIASGKSEMEAILDKENIVVLDTDIMAHDILIDKPDVSVAFSEYDVFEHGKLSKSKLSKLVFDNPELKEKLEEIMHPLIMQEIELAFKTFANEKYLFISVPLLFEVGWEKLFDKIVFIKTDDEIRLNRLMERNNYSKEDALKRINSQKPQEEKFLKVDYIIENNSTKEDFRKNVLEFLSNL